MPDETPRDRYISELRYLDADELPEGASAVHVLQDGGSVVVGSSLSMREAAELLLRAVAVLTSPPDHTTVFGPEGEPGGNGT